MEENRHTVTTTLKRFYSFRYQLILEGVLVGAFSGLVVVVFRLLLEKADAIRGLFLEAAGRDGRAVALWFLVLLVSVLLVALLLKWEPYCSGSGIPQLEGEMQGALKQTWWRVLLSKFIGGILSIGCGLSVGREGPSIQLGAMTAKGFARLTRRMRTEERLLMTCGASAGLSAAFNAPIAGILFSLEEIHKNFSPEVLLSAMASSITANFVSRNVFGLQPVFTFEITSMMPLRLYGHVVVLGIILGFLGVCYNRSVALTQTWYGRLKSQRLHLAVAFLTAGILFCVYPIVLGGGHSLVHQLSVGEFTVASLTLLFVVKFVFSMVSFGSGAPGGIFLPLLVLGAVVGNLYYAMVSGIDPEMNGLLGNFIILGMAGYFSAIVRAPMTGIILISEMTGSFSHLLTLCLVSLLAYLIPDMMKCKPIYDQLLTRILSVKKGGRAELESGEKVLVSGVICYGAQAVGRQVSHIQWPSKTLIVSITRGDQEFIPKGDTTLKAGDRLVLLSGEEDAPSVYSVLEEVCECVEKKEMNR